MLRSPGRDYTLPSKKLTYCLHMIDGLQDYQVKRKSWEGFFNDFGFRRNGFLALSLSSLFRVRITSKNSKKKAFYSIFQKSKLFKFFIVFEKREIFKRKKANWNIWGRIRWWWWIRYFKFWFNQFFVRINIKRLRLYNS